MTTLIHPDPHWRRSARPYVDRLARFCGLSDSGRAEEIIAEAMQAAAESEWSAAIVEAVRRMEDDRK